MSKDTGHLAEAWSRLRGGELTPGRAAASVAVGLAIGVTPLWGLHLPLVLAVCLPLRLDAPVAYLAANVSLPFVSPFLSLAEVELGSWARTGHALPLAASELRARGLRAFAADLVLGTAMFAPLVAAVGGAIAYGIASVGRAARGPRGKSPLDEAMDRVARRYANGRRAAGHYVRSKLARDPVARAIAQLGSLGEVVDVGSGRGQLALLLLESARATRVVGFDWDEAKVADAQRAAGGLPARFVVEDVRAAALPACDTALLVDVLHYLTDGEQDALLAGAAGAARTRVVVREMDPDRGLRSTLTRMQERITTRLGMNRGARVHPRPIAALVRPLEQAGFDVTVEPCWGSTPLSNVLLVATRRVSA